MNSRVMISMSLLVGSKVMNVCVPFLFKGAVDSLGVLNMNSAPETVLALSSSLLIGCKLKLSSFTLNPYYSLIFPSFRWHCPSRSRRSQRATKRCLCPCSFAFDPEDCEKCVCSLAQFGPEFSLESTDRSFVQSN